jgi:dihydroorotase
MNHPMIRIENARVVDPSQKIDGMFDVLIENGRIRAIEKPGSFSAVSGSEAFDARGMILAPGLIDVFH